MNNLLYNSKDLMQKLRCINIERNNLLELNRDKPIVDLECAIDIITRLLEREGLNRIVVGIGGFPACGKTSLAKLIVRNINGSFNENLAVHIPMDGFHYSNKQLELMSSTDIKGDISTYDISPFVKNLSIYKTSINSTLFAPDYIRELHDVAENIIEISQKVSIIVTEGIYIGYSVGEWAKVLGLLDVLFYLDDSPENCADRIVLRNLKVGRCENEIEKKLHNDFVFMKTSILTLNNANYIIRI